MHIRATNLRVLELPLRVPFRTALRSTNSTVDIRLIIETDNGLVGLGSASPTPAITGETTQSIVAAIQQHIVPAICSLDLLEKDRVFHALATSIVHNTAAKAAVDIALHDLYAKLEGRSLLTYLGGVQSSLVVTDATVSLAAPADMAEQARALLEKQFQVLKVKLGGRDGLDLERIKRIRDSVGSGVVLRVDANQSWGTKKAIRLAKEMELYDIELIEQPVQCTDILGLKQVSENTCIPIAADESVHNSHDLLEILSIRAADIVNVKLMKTGGIHEAEQMIRLTRSAGIDFMIGSMMEGPASVTAAAQLAAAYSCRYVDLDAAYFLDDSQSVGGIQYNGPEISTPTEPGMGIRFCNSREEQQ